LKNWKAHVALSCVSLFYGINYTVAKGAMNEAIVPLALTFLRISAVCVLFWLLHLIVRDNERIERQDFFKLIVCGLTGVAINQTLFLSGLALTSTINASIIVICTPVVVLLFSYFMLKESISLKKTIGILLGLSGSVVLIVGSNSSAGNTATVKGDLLICLNVISYSFYLVYAKSLMKKYKPLTVIKWVFLFGMMAILPVTFKDVYYTDWQSINFNNWLAIGYVLLFATFATYLLNIYALKKVNASIVGFYIYFQVIVNTIMSVLLKVDTLDGVKIVSCLLIFTAVFLVSGFSFKRRAVT